MITAPPVMGGKISGGWVNFTLTIELEGGSEFN